MIGCIVEGEIEWSMTPARSVKAVQRFHHACLAWGLGIAQMSAPLSIIDATEVGLQVGKAQSFPIPRQIRFGPCEKMAS